MHSASKIICHIQLFTLASETTHNNIEETQKMALECFSCLIAFSFSQTNYFFQ